MHISDRQPQLPRRPQPAPERPPSEGIDRYAGAFEAVVGTVLPSAAGAFAGSLGYGALAGAVAGAAAHSLWVGDVKPRTLLLGAANGALCGLVGGAFGPGGALALTAASAVGGALLPELLDGF